MSAESFFAQSYAEARAKFTAAAEAAGLDVQAHVHPLVGRDGEVMAMDVARFGAVDARALLVVTSGCHGAEGYCGSGVQNALLADAAFPAAARAAGVAVLYVHALNPYGFSWIRRTTQENVDLNRNWQEFDHHGDHHGDHHAPLPANAGYEEIARFVVPATWPPPPENEAGLAAFAQRHGERALQAALSQGQYTHPEGLFFGGHRPTWSRQTLQHVLEEHGQRCARLAWIDIHTGLGPSGHGERIFADRNHPVSLARARAWWGVNGAEVTSMYDGSSASAELTGLLFNAAYLHCPQAEYTGLALEFGTLPMNEVMFALRADQWLYNHPEASGELRAAIKRQVRDAFYVDTPQWKQQVVTQGLEVAQQAVAGLAGPCAG
ncbi:MAG: M14 family metallopeptidase [Burkholderiales bacterium]|nr:M14 family metallopeptidase [Burkholderiales bacterium]